MNKFPDKIPPLGQNVDVKMHNGDTFTGYYDGLQWWVGVPDSVNDLPVANQFVATWLLEQ